jgi:ABC-2 type transport system permease protein
MSTTYATPDLINAAPRGNPSTESGIPFGRLLRVEWLKTVDTRASRWLLALVGLVTAGLMFAPVIAVGSFDQNIKDYTNFAAFGACLLLPVVAALVMTSEWSQRTVLTTFTQEPRRRRVIFAKLGAIGILSALASAFAAVVSVIALAVSAGIGRDVSWHLSASIGIGFVVGIALNVAMGAAFGAVLMNSATAIVAIFALPTAFALLNTPLHAVGEWIDPNHMSAWIFDGRWDGHVAKIIVQALLWIALPITAGIIRTVRREIN